jgi:molybdopterin-guanine dinucleotide biosynthesis protein A
MTAPLPVGATAAVILAGGRGRRLGGAEKPLLRVDGRRIIDRQLAVLRPLFADIAIAADPAAAAFRDLGLPVIADRRAAGEGPLAGIEAALAWLPARAAAVVCVAGDMPYLAPALLARLRDGHPDALALVPRHAGGVEPL